MKDEQAHVALERAAATVKVETAARVLVVLKLGLHHTKRTKEVSEPRLKSLTQEREIGCADGGRDSLYRHRARFLSDRSAECACLGEMARGKY